MPYAVLIVEDEKTLARNITTYLQRNGFEAEAADSAEDGLARLDSFKPDAVLLDLRLPGMDGLAALARFRAADPNVSIIMITGHGSVEMAVEAMKAGAYDFLTKPVSLSKLRMLLEKALGEERKEHALSYYQRRDAEYSGIDKLIGESEAMRALRQKIAQVSEAERQMTDADAPAVLITGETGSGKELVARAVHFAGPRSRKPFVEINCASIPVSLLESELFGHERGAFTDARERKLGLVETADGGTGFECCWLNLRSEAVPRTEGASLTKRACAATSRREKSGNSRASCAIATSRSRVTATVFAPASLYTTNPTAGAPSSRVSSTG